MGEWAAFIEVTDAFSVRQRAGCSADRVAILCADGVRSFNREMYELVLDVLKNEDTEYPEVYWGEINRF